MTIKAEKKFLSDPRGFVSFEDIPAFNLQSAQYSYYAFVVAKDMIIEFDKFQDRLFDVLETLSPYVLSLRCVISYQPYDLRTVVSIGFHHFALNIQRINLIFSKSLLKKLVENY